MDECSMYDIRRYHCVCSVQYCTWSTHPWITLSTMYTWSNITRGIFVHAPTSITLSLDFKIDNFTLFYSIPFCYTSRCLVKQFTVCWRDACNLQLEVIVIITIIIVLWLHLMDVIVVWKTRLHVSPGTKRLHVTRGHVGMLRRGADRRIPRISLPTREVSRRIFPQSNSSYVAR